LDVYWLDKKNSNPKTQKTTVSGMIEPGQGQECVLVTVLGMFAVFMELIACDMSVCE
jgi:hypothetical protein